MANKQPLWVMVKDADGTAVTSFTVSTDSTVGDLKAALQAAGCTTVTAHDMGLIYMQDELPDTSTLREVFLLGIFSFGVRYGVKVIQKYRQTASGALEFLIHVRTQSTPVLDLYVKSSDSLGSLKPRLTKIIGRPADQLELSDASGVLEGYARCLKSLGSKPEYSPSWSSETEDDEFTFARDPHENNFDVYVQKEELVGSLKRKIADLIGYPVARLRIICKDTELQDDRTVSDYSIEAGSVVNVFLKLRGGDVGALLRHTIYPDVQICMDHKLLKTDVPFKSEALDQIASDVSANTGNVACERCILGKDMADWILKDPRKISSDGMSFSISFPGEGRYECSVTGLRFETTAETTITYRYCSWDQYFPDITRRGWSPASPLFDIKVTGAELTAIEIPHFLCIDGQPSENELCFFHMEEEGGNYTVLAPSLVFSKYAVLLKPTFTLIGFVQSILKMFPVHGIVVIFRTHVAKLTLHVYLIPNSRDIEKAVHSHEKERFSVEINKPPQTRPLRIGQKYSLKTKSSSVIRPEILEFYYLSNNQRQSFCEVRTNDINIAVDLKFLECSPHGDKYIWECELEPEDMQIQPLKEDMQIQPLKEKHFMHKHETEIIQRLSNPEPILDHLLSKSYVTHEDYDRIRSMTTYQEKNRELFKVSRSWTSKGKCEFYMLLKQQNPHLVRFLEEQ